MVLYSEMGSERVQPESERSVSRSRFRVIGPISGKKYLNPTGSGAYRARTDQRRAENGQAEVADRADWVDCLQYPAEIERVSGAIGAPNVTRRIPIKLKYCDFSLQ